MLLLLAATSRGWAQKAFIFNSQQKNGFIAVSMGISQPLGTFGAQNSVTNENGMALMGQTASVSGGYRIAGPLGLMARYDETQNSINTQALLNQYSQSPATNLIASTTPGKAGRWQVRTLMVGPYVTIPLGRFAVDVRALAGQAWAVCPQTSVAGMINQTNAQISTDNREAKALTSSLGLSLRYRISPTVAVHVNGDYTTGRFTFTDVPMESRSGNQSQATTFTSKKMLTTAMLSAGLTIQFRARNRVF